jgi:hypothetical protein
MVIIAIITNNLPRNITTPDGASIPAMVELRDNIGVWLQKKAMSIIFG